MDCRKKTAKATAVEFKNGGVGDDEAGMCAVPFAIIGIRWDGCMVCMVSVLFAVFCCLLFCRLRLLIFHNN